MQFVYNGIALHELGELTISQSRTYEGGDAPHLARLVLKVRVETFAEDFAQNYDLQRRVREAVQTQHASLQWINDETGETYLNQPVVLVSHELPEEWGTPHQVAEFVFHAVEQLTAAQSRLVSATAGGLDLGAIEKWQEGFSVERFDAWRSDRERIMGRVQASGQIKGDATLAIEARRAGLLAAKTALMTRLARDAEAALVFGDFSQLVRVDDFKAEVDQHVWGIQWSLSVSWLKNAGANLTTCRFSAQQGDGQDGQLHLSLSGSIAVPLTAGAETVARDRLTALAASIRTQYGYTGTFKIEREESTAEHVSGTDADGTTTFVQLSFSYGWSKWRSDALIATLDDTRLGPVRTWSDRYETERAHPLAALRARSFRRLALSGTMESTGDTTDAARRAQLIAQRDALLAAIAAANAGQLRIGTTEFSGLVRVGSFVAEVNEALTGIDWTLDADLVLDPARVTSDYTLAIKDDFTGAQTLSFSGRLSGGTEAAARTALAVLRINVLAQAVHAEQGGGTFTGSTPLRQDITPSGVWEVDDGSTFTELRFDEEFKRYRPDISAATFAGNGSVTLGQVMTYEDGHAHQRASERFAPRKSTTGRMEATGVWKSDPDGGVAQRRTQLMNQKAALETAFNVKQGTWTHLGVTRTIRPEEFKATIDQAYQQISWRLSATYDVWPTDRWSVAEYSATTREEDSGDVVLSLAGSIVAVDEAEARVKLAAIRAGSTAGYTPAQQVRNEVATKTVDGGTDGTALVELSFADEYRRRSATVRHVTVRRKARADRKSGSQLVTWSGTVTASGASADAAYAAALTRAGEVGLHPAEGALLSSDVTQERRRNHDELASCTEEFVRLEFSYDYQARLATGQGLIEFTWENPLSGNAGGETFGTDTETLSGTVAAPTWTAAEGLYTTHVKPLAVNRLVLGEKFEQQQQRFEAEETAQETAWKFTLVLHRPKAAGTFAVKYALSEQANLDAAEMAITVSGSVFADTSIAARSKLETFLVNVLKLDAAHGTRRSGYSRTEDGAATAESGAPSTFFKLDFSDTYIRTLTGDATLIESDVTDEVEHSGHRWSVKDVPFNLDGTGGISIPQHTGLKPGRRTVRASALCAVAAAAEAWTLRHRLLLTGDAFENFYPEADRISRSYQYARRSDGTQVRLARIEVTFSEILPYYPAPPTP